MWYNSLNFIKNFKKIFVNGGFTLFLNTHKVNKVKKPLNRKKFKI
jgi:hypothetical protein